jgi:hypothetical protein
MENGQDASDFMEPKHRFSGLRLMQQRTRNTLCDCCFFHLDFVRPYVSNTSFTLATTKKCFSLILEVFWFRQA